MCINGREYNDMNALKSSRICLNNVMLFTFVNVL